MLTFEQIKELIELVSSRRLGGVEIERSGFRLKIAGHESAPRPVAVAVETASAAPATAFASAPQTILAVPETAPASAAAASGHILTSPIVGTFYASSSPEAEPFARVGGRVKKGQVLCIVEAMKLMNEIESDVDGTVLEIFPKNSQPVEFGEPLFSIRAD